LIPIITTIFGIIIINISLNKYGIVEYSIFQIQSILTGAAFITICYSMFVLFFFVLKIFKQSRIMLGIVSFILPSLVTLLFYNIFFDYFIITEQESSAIKSLVSGALIIIAMLYSALYSIRNTESQNRIFNGTWSRRIKVLSYLIPFIIILIVILIYSVILYLQTDIFKSIYGFFLSGSIYSAIAIWVSNKHNSNGENSGKKSKSTNENYWIELNLVIIYFVSFVLIGTHQYSTNLYPYLPKNYGGGKPEAVEISYAENKHLKGEIIHSNSNLIFVNVKNQIKVIEWNKVQEIDTNISID